VQTLANRVDKASILGRLERLTQNSPRQWGRMSPHQAVCHLSDSFRVAMGRREASQAQTWFNRTVGRFVALHTAVPWPHGVPTRPEVDQLIGGTTPVEFAHDLRELAVAIEAFTASPRNFIFRSHPGFGPLTDREWMIWGNKHMDHHLRQFGA
jgi:hypothetical protein